MPWHLTARGNLARAHFPAPCKPPRQLNWRPAAREEDSDGPEAPATGWTLRAVTLDQQDSERHPLVPPSRDVSLRQRSGAAAGGDPPSGAPELDQPERPGSRGGSAPSTARAPGRQPYLPFGTDAPESAGSGSGSLWRLAAGVLGVGAPAAAKRQEEAYQRRQAAKKRTTSEEVELTADSKGARIVPVVVELEGGGYVPEHPAAGGSQRRVAFETTVELDDGGTVPLRTESANERSSFVRGVGRVERGDMDGLKQYAAPWGYRAAERLSPGGRGWSLRANRIVVLLLTFLCYTAYHASRKPPSIVKSVLHGDTSADENALDHYDLHWASSQKGDQAYGPHNSSDLVAAGGGATAGLEAANGWAPFNHKQNGKALLGQLDLAFLGAYAMGMFVSGHLGDRVDLRYFLTGGMLGSGACVALFGAAYFWQIHSMTYFIVVQVIGGLLQATGWPSVVSVMANWFGKGKRGLIMGVWNAHTSVGNIIGSLIAAYMLRYGWGWSFIVPGAFIAVSGLVIFSFLVVEPQDIGFLPQSGSVLGSVEGSEPLTPRSEASDVSGMSAEAQAYLERHLAIVARGRGGLVPAHVQKQLDKHHTIHGGHGKHGLWGMGSTLVLHNKRRDSVEGSEADLLLGGSPRSDRTFMSTRDKAGVSFFAAWCIPGVAVFAMTLFFAKLVAYTFLYWLPYYISTTEVGGRSLTPTEAGNLSILFDVGGVLGGAVAGYLSDVSGASALVSFGFVFSAIPFLYLYRVFGELSFAVNIGLMMAAGFFVNGPYALITTAVSADLGTHQSLAGNEKALATVTAIIDGMGSIGAAIGPLMTGYISELPGGFDNVFLMLYGAAASAGLLLTGLVFKEVRDMLRRRRKQREQAAAVRDPSAANGEGRLTMGDTHAPDAFSFLPPGQPADGAVRTIDNETGGLV